MYSLVWRYVKKERNVMEFFLSKRFEENKKRTKVSFNYVQKQYFS